MRTLSILIITAFLVNTLTSLQVRADGLVLPKPGIRVSLSPAFNPSVLKGIKVHPDNPFRFDFILDKGDAYASNEELKEESTKLIKYFFSLANYAKKRPLGEPVSL